MNYFSLQFLLRNRLTLKIKNYLSNQKFTATFIINVNKLLMLKFLIFKFLSKKSKQKNISLPIIIIKFL